MLLAIGVGSLLLLLANADTSVHILSSKYGHGQLVTSSILNWTPEWRYSASKNFVIGGFENVGDADDPAKSSKRPIFVCRALHNGVWVAGGQKEGDKRCTVTLAGSVSTYKQYQLLQNVESAARINWTDWSKYDQVPFGAVATKQDKLYVARRKADDSRRVDYNVGTLSAQDSLGTISYVKEDGQEGASDEGQLLVETEPISYELTDVQFNQQRSHVEKSEDRVLAEGTIRNLGSSWAEMAEAFAYSFTRTTYWGHAPAMFTGLNTSISLRNKTRLADIKWGIHLRENRTDVYTVEIALAPGTAVNVTLRGKNTVTVVPYSGKLYSRYEDRTSMPPRTIGADRSEEGITDVVPEFGPVYYLSNNSLAPTTLPPPTTEPITTTTTTTMPTTLRLTTLSTTQEQPQQQTDSASAQQYSKDSDENAILGNKRPEGMQGDGPVPFKNEQSAAPSRESSLLAGALLLLATSGLLLLAT